MHSLCEFKGWLELDPCLKDEATDRNLGLRPGSRFPRLIPSQREKEHGIQRDLAVPSSLFLTIDSRVPA